MEELMASKNAGAVANEREAGCSTAARLAVVRRIATSDDRGWVPSVVVTERLQPDGERNLVVGHATPDPSGTVLDEGYDPYAKTLGCPVWW